VLYEANYLLKGEKTLNKQSKIVLGIAILLIAGLIFYFNEFRTTVEELPRTTVVVAAEDIPADTVIKEDMVTLEERFSESLYQEASGEKVFAGDPKTVIGKRTLVPIFKGESIRTQRLITNLSYMDDRSDDEKRTLYVLMVQEIDKALELKAGGLIDIWQTPTMQGQSMGMQAEVLFEQVKIAGIKDERYRSFLPEDRGSDGEKKPTYLLVYFTDEEISRLMMAESNTMTSIRLTEYGTPAEFALIAKTVAESGKEKKGGNIVEQIIGD
jgi:hypothetical protein